MECNTPHAWDKAIGTGNGGRCNGAVRLRLIERKVELILNDDIGAIPKALRGINVNERGIHVALYPLRRDDAARSGSVIPGRLLATLEQRRQRL